MDRTKVLKALEDLPDASFLAVAVVAKAAAEFMAMVIMDDPTPEQRFADAVRDAVRLPMGWPEDDAKSQSRGGCQASCAVE